MTALSLAPASDYLEALTAELRRLSVVLGREDARRVGQRFERDFKALHFRIVEGERDEAGAGEAPARLEPSEGHLELLAALRALDGQTEFDGHDDESTSALVANLDVHVFRDRDGRYGARCTGRRGEREITARSAGWPGPAPAARHAITEWVKRSLRTEAS